MPKGREIERKFLLAMSIEAILSRFPDSYLMMLTIEQRYLVGTGEWAIRVRHTKHNDNDWIDCYLTLKRKISDEECVELETNIDRREYDVWVRQCDPRCIRKERTTISWGGRRWHLDRFLNPEFGGLEIAEIEYEQEGEHIDLPPFLSDEVTADPQYRNFNMVKRLAV